MSEEGEPERLCTVVAVMLQWSLASMSEEGHGGRAERPHDAAASMEPRFNERGRTGDKKYLRTALSASMEPRFNERGRITACCSFGNGHRCFNGASLQ